MTVEELRRQLAPYVRQTDVVAVPLSPQTEVVIEDRSGLTFKVARVEDRTEEGDAEGFRGLVIVVGEKWRWR